MEKAEQPITFIVRRADVKEGNVEGRPRGAQLVLCDDLEEWEGASGGRGPMYTYSWFT